ncbi:hypothetical protein Egran_05744 [Elaphomyces granulatus]|uniref:PH-response regulator protein palH/RIM21 n=1 Tax=Elaphomyces granulatus TaxID=519963 RepID=A0A232LQS6_9EURO|nr:hypothetical protein Egran_05744 [Elaphomyces granulatus]
MGIGPRIRGRQLWARPTSTTAPVMPSCTPFLIPSNGVLNLNSSYSITLTENVVYQPSCTGAPDLSPGNPSAVLDKDPFYSSTSPQLYAMGCMTVISYLLVIILLITPRTFFVGGPGGGASFLDRHGMISGSYSGGSSVVGVGGRPWLQKVAALLVAVSLTIATVNSFKVAGQQYDYGYMDAGALTVQVLDGTEIRIVRVISSTFLWLAQVQTLIRLFPRHKEKVMIKWAGFALILLDTTFAILDNFVAHGTGTNPRLFDDAIPALSYLFELALNLLYAAWVIFYSVSKRRYAYFHPKMRNICLVALLSLIAVLIPAVFFVMDISQPDVAGWGEYIRWVGSAAASVVVWEWVERIEALERDDRKDGILGREIFDGDEMLEVTPSEEVDWPRQPSRDGGRGTGASSSWGGVMGLGYRPLRSRVGFQRNSRGRRDGQLRQSQHEHVEHQPGPAHLAPPPAAVTPVSRADTTSAASTVYYVHYHPTSSPSASVLTVPVPNDESCTAKEITVERSRPDSDPGDAGDNPAMTQNTNASNAPVAVLPQSSHWLLISNLFKRRRTAPPKEVVTAEVQEQSSPSDETSPPNEKDEPRNFRCRVNNLLSSHAGKGRPNSAEGSTAAETLPITVIPSRTRTQQTWSPQPSDDTKAQGETPVRGASVNHSSLPVRVIPAQHRLAAPWPRPAAHGMSSGRNHRLRYDPDTAALVGVEPDLHSPMRQDDPIRDTSSANETLVVLEEHDSHMDSYRDSSSRSPEGTSFRQPVAALDIRRLSTVSTSSSQQPDTVAGEFGTTPESPPAHSAQRPLVSRHVASRNNGYNPDLEAGPNPDHHD